ncbi:MAG: GAF domain-containing protein [Myxococcales bacterium]|nr:GAF domain-containing protein [Myxococcales bacterium]MCB9522351.1 GAF domain-containing protein [Myxococcales bacterium]
MARFEIHERPGRPPHPVEADHWLEALKAWLVAHGRSADTHRFNFDLQADGGVLVLSPTLAGPLEVRPVRPVRAPASTAPPPIPSDDLSDPFHDLPDPLEEPPRTARPRGPRAATATDGAGLEGRTQSFDAQASIEGACAQLLDACLEAFPSAAGSVFLIDARERALYFAVVRGPQADALHHRRLPLEVGLVGASIRTRRSINLDHPAEDPRFARSLAASIGWVPSNLVCAPIMDGRRVFGAVELLERPGGYADEDEARIRRAARRLGRHLATR